MARGKKEPEETKQETEKETAPSATEAMPKIENIEDLEGGLSITVDEFAEKLAEVERRKQIASLHYSQAAKRAYAEGKRLPWNKGVPMKESTRQKMSATKRAKFAQGITKQWNTGKRLSEAHRRKCSIALKGRIVSPETRQKISAAQRGKPRVQTSGSETLRKRYREGEITPWNKGLTKEMDARLTRSPEASRKCSLALMGHPFYGFRHLSPQDRLKISEGQRGRVVKEETRRKLSLAFKGRFVSDETRRKLSLSHIGKPNHQTPETLRKILMKVRQRPTQPEQQLIDFFQAHFPNQWKYVGNGSLLIGNPARNPDFVNCNGKLNLIEFNGFFRHTEAEEIERAAFFDKHGYRTLFLHYVDLKDLDVLATKIAGFSENSEQEKVSLSSISQV